MMCIKAVKTFVLADFPVFAVGFIAAFIAGLIVVRTLVVMSLSMTLHSLLIIALFLAALF
jgi:undecaprenyl pyrophosphate phosphatase UppP